MVDIKRHAGRPRVPAVLRKIPVGYKLQRWIVDWLRCQDKPAAVLIEEALCEQHKLTPPKGDLT